MDDSVILEVLTPDFVIAEVSDQPGVKVEALVDNTPQIIAAPSTVDVIEAYGPVSSGLSVAIVATHPSSPYLLQLIGYSGITPSRFEYWNGASWQPMDGSSPPTGSVPNTALATNPLARVNHTGSQLAATISDLAATVLAYRLDQFAAPTSSVGLAGQRLTSVAEPVSTQDAATKNYVDTRIPVWG